jgi:hypothetical protein
MPFQSPVLIPKFSHLICDIGKDIQNPSQDNLVLIFFEETILVFVDQFENDFLQSIGQKFCHNFENTIEE